MVAVFFSMFESGGDLYNLLLTCIVAILLFRFLFKTGRWLVSLIRPDLIRDPWKPVRATVTRAEADAEGWHIFFTYTAEGQTFSFDGIVLLLRSGGSAPTHVDLVYQEKDPSKWDWAEDRELLHTELQDTRSTWFWLLLVGGLMGMIIALAYYYPDLLRKIAERLP